MEDGLSVGRGSILGPGQDANQGGLLDSHALAARQFDEPGEPRLEDGLGRDPAGWAQAGCSRLVPRGPCHKVAGDSFQSSSVFCMP